MFPVKEFEKRFRGILDEMDNVMETAELGEEAMDDLAELNAESEDALFLLNEIGEDDEEAAEALEDAYDEFAALCEDYRALSESVPEIANAVRQLEMLLQMIKNNM